ncbi:hypothetical protein Q3G72_010599 [Acer saccharum]|nr:hypothetical protein Q3G72_010599 [Acer saccharum]
MGLVGRRVSSQAEGNCWLLSRSYLPLPSFSPDVHVIDFLIFRSAIHIEYLSVMKYVKPHTLYDGLREMNSKLTGTERLSGKSYLLLGLNIRRDFVGLALTDYLISQVYPIMPCKNHMDSVTRYFPGLISQHNLYGFIVGKPRRAEKPSRCEDIDKDGAKFISDLCSIEKFNGLKYTYWSDLYASEHKEYYYKRYVEHYPGYDDLPLYKKQLLVQKYHAVATLEAYISYFKDVNLDYQNANKNLNANK